MGWATRFLAWMRSRQAARDAKTPPWIPRAQPPADPFEFDLDAEDRQPTPASDDTRPTLPDADRPPSSHPPGRRKPGPR